MLPILSYNEKTLNNFNILGGLRIVPYQPTKLLKICPTVPNLKVPIRYRLDTKCFPLVADIFTD